MQYFTKELWKGLNDERELVRARAEEEWKVNSQQYRIKFERIKKRLPRRFVDELFTRNGFHDYIFVGINFVSSKNIVSRKNTYSCELKLTDGRDTIWIMLSSLTRLSIDINSFADCILGNLMWGYGEFDIDSDGNLQLNIICDFANEMQFNFKKLRFNCRNV